MKTLAIQALAEYFIGIRPRITKLIFRFREGEEQSPWVMDTVTATEPGAPRGETQDYCLAVIADPLSLNPKRQQEFPNLTICLHADRSPKEGQSAGGIRTRVATVKRQLKLPMPITPGSRGRRDETW